MQAVCRHKGFSTQQSAAIGVIDLDEANEALCGVN
jgi:hypothetical protein